MARREASRLSLIGARAATARGAAALGSSPVGAAATGAAAFGAVAVGALAIRRLAVRRGKVGHLSIDDLEVGRLRVRELIVDERRDRPRPFDALRGQRFVNLTTFRKNGEPVVTTIWFAEHGGNLYATTPPDSGKMKRIRNDPRVLLIPSNARGKALGESVEGLARPVEGDAPEGSEEALRDKYRLGLSFLRLFNREVGRVTLEVRPAPTEGA